MPHSFASPPGLIDGPLPLSSTVASVASTHRMLWQAWAVGLAIYLVAMWVLTALRLDFAIADHWYAWQGHHWSLRHHWLTSRVLHEGGKRFSIALWLAVAACTVIVWHRPGWRSWRRPLAVLLASVLLSTLLAGAIKHSWAMDCPWDLQRYGGTQAYVGLFQARPAGMPPAACFPSAHASSGFAWIALYFAGVCVAPRWRWAGLAVGIGLGTVFAGAQQLRGAHFLSHDITTLMLCWTVALVLHGLSGQRT